MRTHAPWLTIFAILTVACGSSATTTDGAGSMSASIGGSAWTANLSVQATKAGSLLSIGGTGTAQQINLVITASAPGTYQFNVSGNAATVVVGTQAWVASVAGGSGNVVLTTLTSDHAVGTFSFSGLASTNTGATGTKAVTAGSFDVTY